MSKPIISVEKLGKSYLIGHESKGERYTTLRDVMGRQARNFLRKTRDMLTGRQIVQGDAVEEFWALKDVSFEVQAGEVVGIIGRNGAGKSTLLKVLSRITEPTEGRVTLRGRVASLLEVGTGFHPELTGRENIFLNGAILGMTRSEVKNKFDQIVEFAEVEKFLDTPVKRYSTGMYVRLAFSVAAHLDPEIFVVDEVLAVGDTQFQKKCLGKMQDVAIGGRTVLFVSHNMSVVQRLCRSCLVLDSGQVTFDGTTSEAIKRYQDINVHITAGRSRRLSSSITLTHFECDPRAIYQHSSVSIRMEIESSEDQLISDIALLIHTPSGERTALIDLRSPDGPFRVGRGKGLALRAAVSHVPFVENDFSVGLYINADSVCDSFEGLDTLTVLPADRTPVLPRDAQFRGVVELRADVRHAAISTKSVLPTVQGSGSD